MLKTFQTHIINNLLFLTESKLLIAISGGLDSVVLTHLCHTLKLNITLAHCNFNLRDAESDTDETFVLELAETLDLEVFTQRFETETYAKINKLSIQMAARELRYNWFEELSSQLEFDFILTGHHADDNLETFLINLTRGTGLEGLKGIPEVNETIVRPLLPFSREDIEYYANENDLKWREDSSNASTKYLRNKLRHEVIPNLKETNPQLLQNFKQTLNNLNDTASIVEESVDAVLKRAIKKIDNRKIVYTIEAFKKLNNPKAYLYEVFKDYGFIEWNDILALLDAQSGKQLFSKTHRLLKDRDCLILTEIASDETKMPILITSEDHKTIIENGHLLVEKVETVSELSSNEIYIDKELLKFPLIVRNWVEGDYFYPLGMQGKKKLSKYFKDEKLSLIDKEKVQLLCSKNDIVWVIGKRADNRFKVSNKTKNLLKITLQE